MQYRVFRLKEVAGVRLHGDSTLIEAADDAAAIALAERLMDADALQIWQGRRLVGTLGEEPPGREIQKLAHGDQGNA
jgi:hypothetical protein